MSSGLVAGNKMRALIITAIIVSASTVTAAVVVVRSERGVDLTVHTDKLKYGPGEGVLVHLHLKNYGLRTVKLTYPTSIILEFAIYDSNGMLVFHEPKYALMCITKIELRPGETRSFGHSWDQLNETGEHVELPDSFTVCARSLSYEHRSFENSTFSISG